MSTNQEKSFTATLTTSAGHLHLPYLTNNRKILAPKTGYDPFSFESQREISNYLCVSNNAPASQLTFYFRCIDDYYSIYVMTNRTYHNRALSNEDEDFISAHPYDDDQTTYNLLSGGKIVTMDQLQGDSMTLRIQTRGGRTLHVKPFLYKNKPHQRTQEQAGQAVCTGKKGGVPLDFRLNILQRNILL
ncbi:hypothetical protein [Pseudomonas putida]|uniref:hypothetical protein n=1 Tax=Pseudomonas putida TaxID=303 RepID=UPI003D9824E2